MNRHLVFACVLIMAAMGGGAFAQSAPGSGAARPPASSGPGASASKPALTEDQKIEALIKGVETSGLGFIRNGSEYDSKKAAEHLRSKWTYARKRPRLAKGVATARDFIKNIASASSMSNKPYQIALQDGRKVPSGEWLTARLQELEAPPPTVRPVK